MKPSFTTSLRIYNSLSRDKELFTPIHAPFVGMYVCGPTVYNFVHLGNCRTFTSFDIVFRYLTHLGYKVRYVRNITDVGHLIDDADEGEDKIAKKARLDNLEPMEIVQKYTIDFHDIMQILNNLPPSIEPTATAHLFEQIEWVQSLIKQGFAYESQGSVYFDVRAYHDKYPYGILSGAQIDEQIEGYRDLDGQHEKRSPIDFALWKKADERHIMQWNAPWSTGFPGWHLECSAMSTKYLGAEFDIHGGGMDLKFPHHECEIAQATACNGHAPVRTWMHANMLTMNGQKMSKSLGNTVMPHELFTGTSPLLSKAYSPMTLRFFILQTHYRSTLDLSEDALLAAEKGYTKLLNGLKIVDVLTKVEAETIDEKQTQQILQSREKVYAGMNDDFNTAIALAALFDLTKKINQLQTKQLELSQLSEEAQEVLLEFYPYFIREVLGLQESRKYPEGLMHAVLEAYRYAKEDKKYDRVDALRASMKNLGIVFKDSKSGVDWAFDEQS